MNKFLGIERFTFKTYYEKLTKSSIEFAPYPLKIERRKLYE